MAFQWLSKGQTGTQSGMPSDAAGQFRPLPRLLSKCISTHVLEGHILGGDHDGKPVSIPHITLYSCKSDLTFIVACHQLPIHLAFAMTINKSQAESARHVGIDLCTPVLTHDWLYVALSRSTDKIHFMFYFHKGKKGLSLRVLCIQRY